MCCYLTPGTDGDPQQVIVDGGIDIIDDAIDGARPGAHLSCCERQWT
jgi:hypothetical protein